MFTFKDMDVLSHTPGVNARVKVQKRFLFKTPRVESRFGPDPVRHLAHSPHWRLNMEYHFRGKLRKNLFLSKVKLLFAV